MNQSGERTPDSNEQVRHASVLRKIYDVYSSPQVRPALRKILENAERKEASQMSDEDTIHFFKLMLKHSFESDLSTDMEQARTIANNAGLKPDEVKTALEFAEKS